MKFWAVFRKSIKEQRRDLLTLSLSLTLAPIFVFLYSLFFSSGGSTTYQVAVINQDIPTSDINGGELIIDEMRSVSYSDGSPFLDIAVMDDEDQAVAQLKDREFELVVIIPAAFSETIAAEQNSESYTPAEITFYGDLTNPYYAVAAVFAGVGIETYVQDATGLLPPYQLNEIALGDSGTRTEFEIYVPGMLVFSIVILIFQVAMTAAYEVESGTLKRLKLTRLSTVEFLGGMSASVVLIGILSFLLAVAAAFSLGFTSYGSMWLAILVGVLTTFAIMGAGLIVAAFSENVSQAFIIANFPLVLFMFFTGVTFPISELTMFHIGDVSVGFQDLLPPTHAVSALNKIMTLGLGFKEIQFELLALTILSVIFFFIGALLFQRRHMRVG